MRLRIPRIRPNELLGRLLIEPKRPRISLRGLMALVALVALVMTVYVVLVDLPIQRRRFRNADRAVSLQIDFLRQAAVEEQRRAQDVKGQAASSRDRAEEEERKADKFPEGSAERSGYLKVMALWDQAWVNASHGANRSAGKARKYQAKADSLTADRQKVGSDLKAFEMLAKAAETFLAELGNDENFPSELNEAKTRAHVEHLAKSGGRTAFPTAFGPKKSAIEATAVWEATKAFQTFHPGVALNGFKVKATNRPPAPFLWDVSFINPGTGRNYRIDISFSDVSVFDYMIKNP